MKKIFFLAVFIFSLCLTNTGLAKYYLAPKIHSFNNSHKLLLSSTSESASSIFENNLNSDISFHQIPAQYHLSYDSVSMPAGQPNMGLLGLTYRLNFKNWFYAGVVGFGAVKGEQGGLFVLGLSGGIQHHLFNTPVMFDVGMDAGGGGGHTSLVGNGLMLRPHAGLLYDFRYFQAGLDYTQVKFPDGQISSSQISIAVNIPTAIDYANPNLAGEEITSLNDLDFKQLGTLYFNRFYFAPLLQIYFPANGTKDTTGRVADGRLTQIGIEVGKFFNSRFSNVFAFLKAGGAFSGEHNGYMDVLGGLGYQWQVYRSFYMIGSMGVGAGGGGNVNTGGGVLLQPEAGFALQLTQAIRAEIAEGYVWAPDGDFKAWSTTVKLSYLLALADTSIKPVQHTFTEPYFFKKFRVGLNNETYFNALRKTGLKENVNLVEVKLDAFLNKYFYLLGQAGSAYTNHAGGYSTGMLGAGVTSRLCWHQRMDVGAEFLAGAGGGGGMDVGGGALLQPRIYGEFYFNPYFSADAGVGYLYAPRGKVKSITMNVGLTLHFAALTAQ